MDKKVIHDKQNKKFYIKTPQGKAEMNYSCQGDVMEIYHTFVPPALRGQGIARLLGEKAVHRAEKKGLMIKPSCSFMEIYLKRNKKYSHLKKWC